MLVTDCVTASGTAGSGNVGTTAGAETVATEETVAATAATMGLLVSFVSVTACGMIGSCGFSTGFKNNAASRLRRDTRPGSTRPPPLFHISKAFAAPDLSPLFSRFSTVDFANPAAPIL